MEVDELSARRTTGRDQVAPDGTRLIDGVPFGKPYVKQPTPARPSIPIPSRKRRRIDNGEADYNGSVATAHSAADRQRTGEDGPPRKRRVATGKTDSQLAQDSAPYSSTLRERQDAAQQAPSTNVHGQTKKRDKGVDAKSISTLSSSSVSSEDASSDTDSSSDSTSDEDTPSSSSDDSSESESDIETKPKSKASFAKAQDKNAAKPPTMNPPGMGNTRTRNSNLRSKLRRKLLRMKNSGLLREDANFADLRSLEGVHEGNAGRFLGTEGAQSQFEKKRAQLLRDIEGGGIDITTSAANGDPRTAATAEGEPGSQYLESKVSSHETATADTASETKAPKRQSKLDTSGARRLLFGSLGIRTPKTKADEERARNKLAAKTRPPNGVAKPAREDTQEQLQPDTPGLEPVENWQDFLILQATECVYDNVELSEPPFPFVQRWNNKDQDAIHRCRQNNTVFNTTKAKGRKRKSRTSAPEAINGGYCEYEEADINEYDNGDLMLDYGEDENAGSRKETSQQQELQNGTNDLPPLPADISSRPVAKGSEIGQAAVIAFKQLDVSKETNWQPQVSEFQTAEVEEILDNSVLRVRLAVRDRARQEASEEDDEGSRIYTKFEMPGYDDGGKDDGIREIALGEMIEPKILRPGGARSS